MIVRVYLGVFALILIGLFGTFCFLLTTVHPKTVITTTTAKTVVVRRRAGSLAVTLTDTPESIAEKEETEEETPEPEQEASENEYEDKGEVEELDTLANLTTTEKHAEPTAKNTPAVNAALPLLAAPPVNHIPTRTPEPQSKRSNFVIRFTDKNQNVVTHRTIDFQIKQINSTNSTSAINNTSSSGNTIPSVNVLKRSKANPQNMSKIVVLRLLPNNTFIFEEDM